jgi:hypothetical protein
MAWQDWAFAVGGFFFIVSLVPTMRGEQKPALTTCIMSVVIVTVFTATMASLELWLSALANAGIAVCWAIISMQRYAMNKRENQAGLLAQIEEDVMDVTLGLEDEAPSTQSGRRPA